MKRDRNSSDDKSNEIEEVNVQSLRDNYSNDYNEFEEIFSYIAHLAREKGRQEVKQMVRKVANERCEKDFGKKLHFCEYKDRVKLWREEYGQIVEPCDKLIYEPSRQFGWKYCPRHSITMKQDVLINK